MRRVITGVAALLFALVVQAQVALDSVGRDAAYVATIITRSQKIVEGLQLHDAETKAQVLNIIANRYFLLSDLEKRHGKGDALDASLYKHHFELVADLSNYLDEQQVEAVKDGLTYGVVPKTYGAYLEMIPSLQENEKRQIMNWLKEAREFAIDAGDAKAKHGWFNKYKGRINNWLSKRGYDLTLERKAWGERIAAQQKNK